MAVKEPELLGYVTSIYPLRDPTTPYHYLPPRGHPMKRCTQVKASGEQCRTQALDSGFCWAHDPSVRDRADAARRKGGHNRSTLVRATRRMPRDMAELSKRILEAFEEVNAGTLIPDRAHAMARLAAVYVQLHQAGELETRLAELEARAQNGGKRWA